MLFKGKQPKIKPSTPSTPRPYKKIKIPGHGVPRSGKLPFSIATDPLNLYRNRPSRPTTRKK